MQASIDSNTSELFQNLAELARANVSGPLGKQVVSKAQNDLVDRMQKKGLISEEDAIDLKM